MQERARQLGGNLEIQSIPGRGTQITVAVPWSEGGIVNRWRLIVDNDASIRQMLRQLIQAIDGEVIGEAEDGAAGITATEHLQPDILLLDVSMPVMGGFEAACQLRSDRALIIQAAGCKVSPAAYREPPTIRSQRSQREAREEQ